MCIKNLKFMSLLVLVCFIVSVTAKNAIVDPPYTESVEQFKQKKHFNSRTQKLLACWLYLNQQNTNKQLLQHEWLYLVKKCMKKITPKSAVLKITQLGKRNMEPVTKFQDILNVKQQLSNNIPSEQKSQFDAFLLQRSAQFKQQLKQILAKGNIQNQIQQQLKKRQKYYLGFIPASAVTHTTVLITISIAFMCCMTWCRFYRASQQKRNQRKLQKKVKDQDEKEVSMLRNSKNKPNISRKKI